MKNFKKQLANHEITFGSWITLSEPATAEILAKSGYDWLVVDMEHSALAFSQAQEIIRVTTLCDITVLIRVMDHNPDAIKKFMDMGAHGIIAPRINDALEAQKIVNAVKYPPVGTRGVGLFRAQGYSLDLNSYKTYNDENSVVIIQIEHIDAIKNIDSILSVDGVDGYIIGPYDLSASMGFPGEFDHREVKEVFERLKMIIKNSDKPWGYHVVNPNPVEVTRIVKNGYKFIAIGVDFLFFSHACSQTLTAVKKHIAEDKGE